MLLLATQGMPQMLEHEHPHLGRLLTPRHCNALLPMMAGGVCWAADNDGFSGVDIGAYCRMLARLHDARVANCGDRRAERFSDRCLFVVVPDVYADPVGTAHGWVRWAPALRRLGLPLAFVAQNGCRERRLIPADHEFDCLFIGGDDEFKLGLEVERMVRVAKRVGKWVHMGRVNSKARLRYAAQIGCDSADGTQWVRWRDRYLQWGLAELAAMSDGRGMPMRLEV